MLVHAHGFAVERGVAAAVHVELDTRGGLPGFSIVGLGASAARDSRERVQTALLNSGFAFPRRRLTANLTPAVASRSAPAFDLALACCVLATAELIDPGRLARVGLFAELGLGGDLRPCAAVAAAAQAAGADGLGGLLVARADLHAAQAVGALPILGLRRLGDAAALLAGPAPRARPPIARPRTS